MPRHSSPTSTSAPGTSPETKEAAECEEKSFSSGEKRNASDETDDRQDKKRKSYPETVLSENVQESQSEPTQSESGSDHAVGKTTAMKSNGDDDDSSAANCSEMDDQEQDNIETTSSDDDDVEERPPFAPRTPELSHRLFSSIQKKTVLQKKNAHRLHPREKRQKRRTSLLQRTTSDEKDDDDGEPEAVVVYRDSISYRVLEKLDRLKQAKVEEDPFYLSERVDRDIANRAGEDKESQQRSSEAETHAPQSLSHAEYPNCNPCNDANAVLGKAQPSLRLTIRPSVLPQVPGHVRRSQHRVIVVQGTNEGRTGYITSTPSALHSVIQCDDEVTGVGPGNRITVLNSHIDAYIGFVQNSGPRAQESKRPTVSLKAMEALFSKHLERELRKLGSD